jgi:hypothetical protein
MMIVKGKMLHTEEANDNPPDGYDTRSASEEAIFKEPARA